MSDDYDDDHDDDEDEDKRPDKTGGAHSGEGPAFLCRRHLMNLEP